MPRLGDCRGRGRTARFTVMTMTTTSGTVLSPPHDGDLVLRLAVSAYPGRYTGSSRAHTESDLRCYFNWCGSQDLAPLRIGRAEIERYVRWMQEIRRYKPSTVSRRMAVVTGFYRACVIDGVLEHSPAQYVRRPVVPPESPTLGLSHLQFEALLTAARESANESDFALVAMLGLLGLRIFEACGADIADVGEEHGHRVLRVFGKGSKIVLVPLPPAVGRAIDQAIGIRGREAILLNRRGRRMDRHCATRRATPSGGGVGGAATADAPAHAAPHLRHHHARRGRRSP
jgi:integrase